ncbi:MAG: ABC transporter ATP-binding protein [Caulobacterales bacterium]
MTDVRIVNLYKHFPDRAPGAVVPKRGAINGLDLDIQEGEFFVLLGPSGCGKTTTLRSIAGLETPTGGTIHIGDEVVFDFDRKTFVAPNKRDLGMMLQSYALWPHMTVAENVAYPLKKRRQNAPRTNIQKRVEEKLALVGLEGLQNRYPAQLSGGQQQRVALARAIVASPRLILFDEPLSNLDAQLRTRLRADLRRIHDQTGSTSVYVTHDQSEAFALADRIAILKDGKLEQVGTPKELFLKPVSRFVAEFIGYENIIPGHFAAPGRFVIDGADGAIATSSNETGRGLVAIRANTLNVAFSRNEAPADAINGRLLSAQYLGDRYQVRVSVGVHELVGVVTLGQWSQTHADAHSEIFLYVKPADIVFISEHAGSEKAQLETAA